MRYYYTSTRIDQTIPSLGKDVELLELSYTATPLFGIYPREMKTCQLKTCTWMFTAALFVSKNLSIPSKSYNLRSEEHTSEL